MSSHTKRLPFLVAALIFLATLLCAQQDEWVKIASLGNQFTSLAAVQFVDSSHGWTAEGSLAIYRTTNGGNTWTAVNANLGTAIASFAMVDTLSGWAVGSQSLQTGKILHTVDGGLHWSLQFEMDNRRFDGTSSRLLNRNITVGSTSNFSPDTGKIVQTSNGGESWTEKTAGDTLNGLTKVQFVDSSHGWILDRKWKKVLRTTDGGVSWTVIPTPKIFSAMSFLSRSFGYAISYADVEARCYVTSDSGLTWTKLGHVYRPCCDELSPTALSFTDSLYGWAFGGVFYQGAIVAAIFQTTDGGVTWNIDHLGNGVDEFLYGGIMLDRTHGWAVGDYGQVLSYKAITGVPEKLPNIPHRFALKQNFPNPFNPTTVIEYEIAQRATVSIKIYDAGGREVRELLNSQQESGVYRLHFDGTGLSSGVYFYTLKAGQFSETKQMTLLK